jgi:hypothetical protein
MQVADDLEAERGRVQTQWQQRLERAHYDAERAARQYQAVEPENRLVARTLEQHWEAALTAEAQVKADYARFLSTTPTPLSAAERTRIRQLAADLPTLWSAATTTAAERQAILRLLIERVIVTVIDDSERVNVEVHWAGGQHTHARIARPVARVEQLSNYPALLARVLSLHQDGLTCPAIAQQLNLEHWHPAKRRQTFNGPMVASLLLRQGVSVGASHRQAPWEERNADEWTLNELAWQLQMPPVTLFSWLRKGRLQARQVVRGGQRQWLVWADATELERLRASRAAPRRWARQVRVAGDDTSANPE